jgi:argininosuccinate lyase
MRGTNRFDAICSSSFILLQGLPSGYNRDFHEEKEILVASLELLLRACDVIPPLVRTTTINVDRMREISSGNFANATELANYLVHVHKQPFRHAHDIVGTLVGKLSRAGKNFMTDFDTSVKHLHEHGIKATEEEIRNVLDPQKVMLTYNSLGGTGKKAVVENMQRLRAELNDKIRVLEADEKRVRQARENCRQLASTAPSTVKDLASLKSLVGKFL